MLVLSSCKDALVGLSIGARYIEAKKKEEEVKQGKNYYLAAPFISSQFALLGSLFSSYCERSSTLSNKAKWGVVVLSNIAPLLGLGLYSLCASVKHEHYETLVQVLKDNNIKIPLPDKLEGRSAAILRFFAEHTGDLLEVAMIAGSVVMIAYGSVALGVCTLASMGYELLDKNGYVPLQMSLLVEAYLPILSSVVLIIGGSLLIKIFAAVNIGHNISPSFNPYIQRLEEDFIRLIMKKINQTEQLECIDPSSIAEMDAPFTRPEEMDYEKILDILKLDEDDFSVDNPLRKYKVNPAHCSRWAVDLDGFLKDTDFEKFKNLFEKVDWESKSALLLGKLKDDDRFIDFLFENCTFDLKQVSNNESGKVKELISKNLSTYVQQLADKKNITVEKFMSDWVREQMNELEEVLQGERRVKGMQQELSEAIYACSIILPYLASPQLNDVDREDILLKLAVEGGGYCARGIKRASKEILWDIIRRPQTLNGENLEGAGDPLKIYEEKLFHALQNCRSKILEGMYSELSLMLPTAISNDVHFYDIYGSILSMGFYPMTQFDRKGLSFEKIFLKYRFAPLRISMFKNYIDQFKMVFEEVGNLEFTDYIIKMINQNSKLTPEQKEHLINGKLAGWLSDEVDLDGNLILDEYGEPKRWEAEQVEMKFQRLALIQLGILIPA